MDRKPAERDSADAADVIAFRFEEASSPDRRS
jgi:hypothetical protein